MDVAVRSVGARTSRTLNFQSNGIKCNQGRAVCPQCGSFTLQWAGWSFEFASEASEVGVSRQALA